MENRINLIFDCDGTLVDSYPAIVDSIERLFRSHNICCTPDEIRELALYNSVSVCIAGLSEKNGLNPEQMLKELKEFEENIDLMRLFPDVSRLLDDKRFRCFVFTHRGESCRKIFDRLGITDRFEEIVDATYHFKRKPDSQGIDYLVNKYSLDKSKTYYVGDRIIDIESGKNAGVGAIFFRSSGLDIDTSKADYIVNELADICDLEL